MAEWYRSVSLCLERAAHYEQKAERVVDPAARHSFLDAAAAAVGRDLPIHEYDQGRPLERER